MANSDAAHLEQLKEARDAITAAIAAGETTITYMVGRRSVTRKDPTQALVELENLIAIYERKTVRNGRSIFRVAKLSRAGGTR